MEQTLEDKKVLCYYLATLFFNKLENEFYVYILPEDVQKPANKFESILLGISHLGNRMKETIGENQWELAFNLHLKEYAKGFSNKHDIQLECDFVTFFDERDTESQTTLKLFVYQNPGDLLPDRVINRILVNPLKRNLPKYDTNVDTLVKYLAILKKYIFIIDKYFDALKDTIQTSFRNLEDQPKSANNEFEDKTAQVIVKRYREIGSLRNCAPTDRTSDEKIIEIYQKVVSKYFEAASKTGKYIHALTLNYIALQFMQIYEMQGEKFMNEHLDYEILKFHMRGLRKEYYQKEIQLF